MRDLQLFQVWADRRRVGPHPGVELALGLFGPPPDSAWFENYARAFWRERVHSYRGVEEGVAEMELMIGDAPGAGRLSVEHTEDLVWFLARAALLITWMDVDRGDREDTTVVLPLRPLCLEVTKLATRCISLGKGLPTCVGGTLTAGLWTAMREVGKDHSPSRYCDYATSAHLHPLLRVLSSPQSPRGEGSVRREAPPGVLRGPGAHGGRRSLRARSSGSGPRRPDPSGPPHKPRFLWAGGRGTCLHK